MPRMWPGASGQAPARLGEATSRGTTGHRSQAQINLTMGPSGEGSWVSPSRSCWDRPRGPGWVHRMPFVGVRT